MKRIAIFISLLFAFFFGGCGSLVTSTEQYKKIDNFVHTDHFIEAVKALEQSKQESFDEKDRVLYWIDLGLLNHYANRDSLAIKNLQLADFAIEELYTKSISKGAASMLLNDNALDYSGEDYENIYINVFKSLSYYKNGLSESALVEIRRLIEKFVTLEQKYQGEISSLKSSKEFQGEIENVSVDFYSSALAHYISMILFYNDNSFDDARISKEKLYEAFDNQQDLYNFPKPKFEPLLEFTGKSKIAFLSFTGNAPLKEEFIFQFDTYKNLVVISTVENGKLKQYSSIAWYGIEGGLHAKFAVPKMRKRGSIVDKIEIFVDGVHKNNLVKLESIENIAFETFKRNESIVYLKSLARTITKTIANEALNKELDKQTGGGDWGGLTRLLSGALINATENADLRITHYFPAYVYTGNIDVNPGKHNIEVVYKDNYNRIIAKDKFDNYNALKNKKISLLETAFLQ